jgi:hypothetical protein
VPWGLIITACTSAERPAPAGASCRHRTGGKGKSAGGRAAGLAQLRHNDAIIYPDIEAPLWNRVILLIVFFPCVPVGQGSGIFPSRGIGPAASLMQEQQAYVPTYLLRSIVWSVAMWSSSLALLSSPSPPSGSQSSPLTDSLQSTDIIHVRLFR